MPPTEIVSDLLFIIEGLNSPLNEEVQETRLISNQIHPWRHFQSIIHRFQPEDPDERRGIYRRHRVESSPNRVAAGNVPLSTAWGPHERSMTAIQEQFGLKSQKETGCLGQF
jgi:hypothetical protein